MSVNSAAAGKLASRSRQDIHEAFASRSRFFR